MGRSRFGALLAGLAACSLVATASSQDGEAERPPAPQEWLAPYGTETVTRASFDRLREDLFRDRGEARAARGIAWLARARDPVLRRAVAQSLGSAYLLGEHLGDAFEDDVVPAIRALAEDADLRARRSLLRSLLRHDSPLARELALRHVSGGIATPEDPAWDSVRDLARAYVLRRLDPDDPGALEALLDGDDPAAVRAWFDAAQLHPATARRQRWTEVEVRHGEPRLVELGARGPDDPSALVRVSFLGAGVVRSEDDPERPTSIDSVSVMVRPAESSRGGAGSRGSGLYMHGIVGFGDLCFDQIVRYLGDGRVRVWLRRRAPGAEPARLGR